LSNLSVVTRGVAVTYGEGCCELICSCQREVFTKHKQEYQIHTEDLAKLFAASPLAAYNGYYNAVLASRARLSPLDLGCRHASRQQEHEHEHEHGALTHSTRNVLFHSRQQIRIKHDTIRGRTQVGRICARVNERYPLTICRRSTRYSRGRTRR
jgi:hypothetical protein